MSAAWRSTRVEAEMGTGTSLLEGARSPRMVTMGLCRE